jgi:hypothetical protein
VKKFFAKGRLNTRSGSHLMVTKMLSNKFQQTEKAVKDKYVR